MKVFLVGANGQIGKQVLQQLSASDKHSVKAMVRKQEQLDDLKEQGFDAVLANLEGSVSELEKAMQGADAVVFSAGSGGSTGYDKTLLIDLDGAVKTMEAAEKVGAKRFVLVSTIQAHRRENWIDELKPYYVAKHYADRMLEASKLNYTIIRPGWLLNEPGTGKVVATDDLEIGKIPRVDVAKTIVAVLDEPNTIRKSFDLISGETDIKEVLQQV
ncbi:SDR family oxidoreductase [Virgibacillus proomii]|uniref:SDR family oxidoreductase n=1 Tax=Virgibacillus proomii TaxID=84407 RepID=UPI001C0F8010|nr:SDR family oxidoreductase [Virgibacillus proomii]MBU5266597.1 SDR family oxidoreductase [Virgibacillus proomii]